MLCTLVFYNYLITITAIVTSVVLFGIVYFALHPSEPPAGVSWPPPPAWTFPLYTVAIAILSAGAANYVGPSGYVLFKVRVVEATTRSNIPIEEIFFLDGPREFALESKPVGDYRIVIIQKKLFESIPMVVVQFDTPSAANQRLNMQLKTLQFVLHPGLTEMYRGQLEYHANPPP
jgi:hypothetical protein